MKRRTTLQFWDAVPSDTIHNEISWIRPKTVLQVILPEPPKACIYKKNTHLHMILSSSHKRPCFTQTREQAGQFLALTRRHTKKTNRFLLIPIALDVTRNVTCAKFSAALSCCLICPLKHSMLCWISVLPITKRNRHAAWNRYTTSEST